MIDWPAVRDTIDLAAVATALLGPAPGRRGGRGRRLWWSCPLGTHKDRNPSFCVDPGKPGWRCFGCGEHGDAAALVMKLNHSTFPEAVAYLTGGPSLARKAPARPAKRAATEPPPESSGLSEGDALALVADAERRLWTTEGTEALDYLHARGLSDETIRAARLGWSPGVTIPRDDGSGFRALGVVIPWFNAGRLALLRRFREQAGRNVQ